MSMVIQLGKRDMVDAVECFKVVGLLLTSVGLYVVSQVQV